MSLKTAHLLNLDPALSAPGGRGLSRLGLLMDALNRDAGAANPAETANAAAVRGTPAPATDASSDTRPVDPQNEAPSARASEAGQLLSELGMKTCTRLELMLNFSRDAANDPIHDAHRNDRLRILSPLPLAEVATRALAQELRSSITRSGLCYVLHLHEWVRSAHTVSELEAKPPMRQAGSTAQPSPSNASNAGAHLALVKLPPLAAAPGGLEAPVAWVHQVERGLPKHKEQA